MSKWELEGARSGSGQAQIMKGPVGHEIKFGFYSGWQGKNLEVSCLCFECGEKWLRYLLKMFTGFFVVLDGGGRLKQRGGFRGFYTDWVKKKGLGQGWPRTGVKCCLGFGTSFGYRSHRTCWCLGWKGGGKGKAGNEDLGVSGFNSWVDGVASYWDGKAGEK